MAWREYDLVWIILQSKGDVGETCIQYVFTPHAYKKGFDGAYKK